MASCYRRHIIYIEDLISSHLEICKQSLSTFSQILLLPVFCLSYSWSIIELLDTSGVNSVSVEEITEDTNSLPPIVFENCTSQILDDLEKVTWVCKTTWVPNAAASKICKLMRSKNLFRILRAVLILVQWHGGVRSQLSLKVHARDYNRCACCRGRRVWARPFDATGRIWCASSHDRKTQRYSASTTSTHHEPTDHGDLSRHGHRGSRESCSRSPDGTG